MPRRATPLSALKVKTAKVGRHHDGDGLLLLVRSPEAAFWLLRYRVNGKTREAGLGRARGHNAVTLSEARERARRLRETLREGKDPLDERETEKAKAKAAAARAKAATITLAQAAALFIETHAPSWRHPKHHSQWEGTLRNHVLPVIGDFSGRRD